MHESVGSRDFWIGKDLERARDEVEFYEASKALAVSEDRWPSLVVFLLAVPLRQHGVGWIRRRAAA